METKKYKVALWSGAGYLMNEPVIVNAHDEEEALVLASIQDPFASYVEDNAVNEADRDEFEKADNYIYLDRSEYGHSNIWLLIENARINACE